MTIQNIPIIAIDGTTASGKGTISNMLANHFNFNYLNSGAIYRIVAYKVKNHKIEIDNHNKIVEIGASIAPIFLGEKVILDSEDIWPIIKTQEYGNLAAQISHIVPLREVVFNLQRQQIAGKGLVAEGRDMTSHVFRDAHIKLYLDAHLDTRTSRRHSDELRKYELDNTHILKSREEVRVDIEKRDYSDMNKVLGKLVRTDDSLYVDTTHLNKNETFELCRDYCMNKLSEHNLI